MEGIRESIRHIDSLMGHENQHTVNLVISFDPNAQDLLNAIVMTLQGTLSTEDRQGLAKILQTSRALLAQVTAISTIPPASKG